MIYIFFKEIKAFFSSLIGYIVIGIFLLILGLLMFVFPDYNVLDKPYASLDPLFVNAPLVFLFLIPAITMRSFAEEKQQGTVELLLTKPISEWDLILGKFLASFVLVAIALIPTLLYYYTIYELGTPRGNLDSGAVFGSYIGLFLLAAGFSSIGIFSSSLSTNQIVSFLLGAFTCFTFFYVFYFISRMPFTSGKFDALIQQFGMDYHYVSLSRGVIDSRDVIYFVSLIILFLSLTHLVLRKRKW